MDDTLRLGAGPGFGAFGDTEDTAGVPEIIEISAVMTADLSKVHHTRTLMVRYPAQGSEMVVGEKNRLTVGRSPSCDIVIPNSVVSRIHGYFINSSKGFVYIDTSSNGSYAQICGNSIKLLSKGMLLNFNGCLYIGMDPEKSTVDETFMIMFMIR